MRINKYIASAGVASRRKADELIAAGKVKVNNILLREPGYDVKEGDIVEVNGIPIEGDEKKVYYILNKPVGYITTVKDDQERPTVMELMKDVPGRLFPVGRLDYNTSGLLIMTNDGDFSYRVAHPKHELGKTYHAMVKGVLSGTKIAKLKKGVDIGGFITSPAQVRVLKESAKHTLVEITIHEGKNRQVRKMFKAVGNPVEELTRVAIGDVKLGRLAVGGFRKLTRDEINHLMGK